MGEDTQKMKKNCHILVELLLNTKTTQHRFSRRFFKLFQSHLKRFYKGFTEKLITIDTIKNNSCVANLASTIQILPQVCRTVL